MNLDLKNPAVQKSALGIVAALAMLGVFFFSRLLPFTYPSQEDQLNVLKADYEKKSTELARARTTVADLPRFEREYEQLHQNWSLAAELLPADRQLAALLRKITLAGQQTGVQFVLFKPNPAHNEQYYTEMPVQVSVTGGYHQVGSFLAELANLRRIITVSNMKVRTNTNTNANAYATTSVEFTASAYSLNTSPAPVTTGDKKEGAANARKSS
jgi:type IV pilus assembly protein PilO